MLTVEAGKLPEGYFRALRVSDMARGDGFQLSCFVLLQGLGLFYRDLQRVSVPPCRQERDAFESRCWATAARCST